MGDLEAGRALTKMPCTLGTLLPTTSYLEAAHPLLALELLAILQPVDSGRGLPRGGTAEFDSVGGRDSQQLLVHPLRT